VRDFKRDLAAVPLALLAGGLGTRVQGISNTIPKALFEVGGSPFIGHQLALVQRNEIRRVVICSGHLGDQIEAYVGDGSRFGLDVQYSREGDRLLGTAGALKQATPLLGDLFWVMYGDTYLDVSFREIFEAFRDSPALGMLTIFRNENQFDQSNVVFKNGRLLAYDKRTRRPEMTYIDYGLALLRSAALVPIQADKPFDLADLYQQLVAQGSMEAFEVYQRFYEIGSPEGLAETRHFFEKQGGSTSRVSSTGIRRAVFLDRDGVILKSYTDNGVPRPARVIEEFELLPRVANALDLLRAAGLALVVVTNQPDVARGVMPRAVVEALHSRLRQELGLHHIYTCYHDDSDACQCRKPQPGLLEQAAAELQLSLTSSFMVGDRWRDIGAGQRVGCTTFLVRQPYSGDVKADFEVPSLYAAAEQILSLIAGPTRRVPRSWPGEAQ
jgi:histidinol-phosphate phosphatase family protein